MALENDLQGGWDLTFSQLACYCLPLQKALSYCKQEVERYITTQVIEHSIGMQ